MLTYVSLFQLSESSSRIHRGGWTLVWKLMSLLFQMMFCLDIADMAAANPVLISVVEVPSLLKVAPSYMNESLKVLAVQMLLGLFWLALLTLLFSELISIPEVLAVTQEYSHTRLRFNVNLTKALTIGE